MKVVTYALVMTKMPLGSTPDHPGPGGTSKVGQTKNVTNKIVIHASVV